MHPRLRAFWDAVGEPPGAILDVGAHDGTWAAQTLAALPGSTVLCFEANAAHAASLSRFEHRICLLGDANRRVSFFKARDGLCCTGDSVFREIGPHYTDATVALMDMHRLDDLPEVQALPRIGMIKLDVQGAELLVLSGAPETLRKTDVVAMEAALLPYNEGAPSLSEVIEYMQARGFCAVDVLDLHYVGPLCAQVDLLFVRSDSAAFATLAACVRTRGVMPAQ